MNVTRADRRLLEAIVLDRSALQKHVWRANIILATADGCGTAEIMRRSGKSKPVVWRWQARFMAEGVEGLTRNKTRPPGKPPLSADTVQKVVDLALGPPPGEETHWTGRMLAKAAGVSLRSVQRILEAHQLAPHRMRTFKLSTDPKFAEKLKDVVGLYVDPPAHAVVLSVDEKSQIQALDRTQPGLPMKPGRAGTMTYDYKRHGTSHAVRSPQHPRWHRHRPQHAAPSPPGVHSLPQYDRGAGPCGKSDPRHRRQLCDPQASKGAPMAGAASPLDVPLRPRPRHPGSTRSKASSPSSHRQRLKRGVFRSVIDLQVAINRFVAETNLNPKPFVWTADPKRVIAAVKRGKQTLKSVH